MKRKNYIYLTFAVVALLSFCFPVSANESGNTEIEMNDDATVVTTDENKEVVVESQEENEE